jgi:hypothetical protein
VAFSCAGNVVVRTTRVGIVGVALVGLGCGGAPLSKSEFDAKANAICAGYTKKINAVPAPRNVGDVPAYVGLVKPVLERGVDELASLRPPRELKATYDSWMSTQREALKQADELRSAAEENDVVGVNRVIQALRDRNKRANALAAKLGAAVCARD